MLMGERGEDTVLIHKRSATGVVQISYPGMVISHAGGEIVLHATWEHAERDLGYTIFAPGDRFTEYFYANQWFNIMRIDAAQTHTLRGWYCNITRPALITPDAVAYDDLWLDLWVESDGAQRVLDEDEFAAATLDDMTRTQAQAGLAEVRRWAVHGLGPFAELAREGPPNIGGLKN